VVAIVLSSLCFDYFLTAPYYSLEINSGDLPYFFIFVIWGLIVAGFSAVRRQVEESLRQAQEELAKRAVELRAANKELEAFAYSVSHDLRAPLPHVVGYAELLQKHASSALDEKSNRYLNTILEAALSFSRIGRAETKKTAINLEQLVAQVIAECAQETGGRDIAWKIGAPPVCYGDRSMLKLVLVNLLSNAVKFTRKRQRAEIAIGYGQQKNDQIEIFVRDNGAGFDMQHANKLFGVCQRLHLPEEFEGTGIRPAHPPLVRQRGSGISYASTDRTGDSPAHRASAWRDMLGRSGRSRRNVLFHVSQGMRLKTMGRDTHGKAWTHLDGRGRSEGRGTDSHRT
jgi:K+-sensing histidine kinase KdpD